MKKLLRILGTITIVGSGMTGIVANSLATIKEGKTIQHNDKLNFSEATDLESLQRNKREFNFNKKISLKKIEGMTEIGAFFQRSENEIFIDNKNNVYFKTNDGIYKLLKNEYVAKKLDNMHLIYETSIKEVNDNNGNVYFAGSNHGIYVLKSEEIIPIKINGINETIWKIVIDNNNNVYIGGDKGAYIIKAGTTVALKIEGVNSSFIGDSKILLGYDNTVYFVIENKLYTLLRNTIKATRITDEGYDEELGDVEVDSLITNGPSLYFKTKRNFVYSLYFDHENAHKVSGNIVNSFVVDKQNHIYYSTDGGTFTIRNYVRHGNEHHKVNEITKWDQIVFDSDNNGYFIKQNKLYKSNNTFELNEIKNILGNKINSIIFNSRNDAYIIVDVDENNSKKQIFLLKNEENNVKSIKNENNDILIFGDEIITFDKLDNLYLFRLNRFDNDKHIYRILLNKEIAEKINLQKSYGNDSYFRWYSFDKNNNLYFILDDGIYFLENNKNEIIKIFGNIDNDLGIRKVVINNKNELYFIFNHLGGWNFKLENTSKLENNVNFLNLIKLSYYLSRSIKEIKGIDSNNLDFGNVEVTSASDSLKLIDEKSVCFKPINFSNTSSLGVQKIKVPSCNYETKAKYLFQITTGLNTNNSKKIVNGWNLNIDDEMILTDFTSSNKKASEIKNTLSKDFDLSNTNKQEQELILNRDLLNSPEQELSVEPKQRLTAQYAIRSISIKTNLDLKQIISGTITAKIIDNFNKEQIVTLSIKETMKILQKYNLLPNEITINEDNSITFSGKAIISRTSESDPKQIFNFRTI